MTRLEAVNASAVAASPAAQEFVGAMIHLLRRQDAGLPAAHRTKVDEAAARVASRLPGSQAARKRILAQLERASAPRKGQLLSPAFADLPVETALELETLRRIVDRLPKAGRPAGGTGTSSFELTFSHLVCDNETGVDAAGSDETKIIFGVMTQAQLDSGVIPAVVSTPLYDKIDTGERRPPSGSERLRLFGPAVLDSDLLITATAIERDLGSDGVTVAAVLAVWLAFMAGVAVGEGFPLAALALGIAAGVSFLVALFGGDDQIGATATQVLSQAQAENLTSNDNLVALPSLTFDGGNLGGVYRAFLHLRKA